MKEDIAKAPGKTVASGPHWIRVKRLAALACCALLAMAGVMPAGAALSAGTQSYDVVIANGRVIDPESGLDALRNIGISNGKIQAISTRPLTGRETIDASGLDGVPVVRNGQFQQGVTPGQGVRAPLT